MKTVEIYSTSMCLYCARAKRLLEDVGVTPIEYRIDTDTARRSEMLERAGLRSVPQIFIDGVHIGGYDNLRTLHESGELKTMCGV